MWFALGSKLGYYVSRVTFRPTPRVPYPMLGSRYHADRYAVGHLLVALVGRGHSVFGPVQLEGDLWHCAVGGLGGRDALDALGRFSVQQHHVGVLCVDLVGTSPDQPVIHGAPTQGGNLRSRGGTRLAISARFLAAMTSRQSIMSAVRWRWLVREPERGHQCVHLALRKVSAAVSQNSSMHSHRWITPGQ